jgi:hypothetical protein
MSETPKTLSEIAAEAKAFPGVYAAKIWQDRRVYINFVGYDTSFAGCRNLKIYYDVKAGWRIDGIRGNLSREFAANARAFAAHVGLVSRDGGALF